MGLLKIRVTYPEKAGFYRICISGFGIITNPLYEATQDLMKSTWNNKKLLKGLLVSALALAILNLDKSFILCVIKGRTIY
jgi:hypothetical protein